MDKLMVKIDDIHLWENNPREISDKDFQSLKKKIERWGLWKPFLVWESKKQIIGGNQRFKAVKELGYKEIWVEYREPKDEAEALEMAIADNESSGEWIKSLLIEQIKLHEEEINLEDYKINIDNQSLENLLNTNEIIRQNEELGIEDLGDTALISFKYEYDEYLGLMELIQNGIEKLGLETKEELLKNLLDQYK